VVVIVKGTKRCVVRVVTVVGIGDDVDSGRSDDKAICNIVISHHQSRHSRKWNPLASFNSSLSNWSSDLKNNLCVGEAIGSVCAGGGEGLVFFPGNFGRQLDQNLFSLKKIVIIPKLAGFEKRLD
jgi:hypothetical protein